MGASKRILRQFQTIKNGDMSQASLTSSVSNINNLDNVGLQLNWTGSPTGSFAVQVSIDYLQDEFGNVQNAGNWTAISLNPSPVTSSGSPIYIQLNSISAPWVRVVYTKVSGSGTLQAWISGKSI